MTEPAARHEVTAALDRLVASVSRERAALAGLRGDVTALDLLAVSLLRQHGPLSPGALRRALVLSPSGTSALVRRLQDAGLAERRPLPGNRRDARVSLVGDAADLGAIVVPDGEISELVDLLDAVAQAADERANAIAARGRVEANAAAGVPEPPRWG